MIVLIDNYDSFSYNLVQMIGSIEPDIKVVRNDQVTVDDIESMKPSHLILSPGPGYPRDAGILEEAVIKLKGKMPIVGVKVCRPLYRLPDIIPCPQCLRACPRNWKWWPWTVWKERSWQFRTGTIPYTGCSSIPNPY